MATATMRSETTKELVEFETRGDVDDLVVIYSGLREIGFRGLYTYMNQAEVIAAAAFLQKSRLSDPEFGNTRTLPLANLMKGIQETQYPEERIVPENLKAAYESANPFGDEYSLAARLGSVSPESADIFRRRLADYPKLWVSERRYNEIKGARGNDNSNLAVPGGIPDDLFKEKQWYLKSIAKLLNLLPRNIEYPRMQLVLY
jgi:hypothetical protein